MRKNYNKKWARKKIRDEEEDKTERDREGVNMEGDGRASEANEKGRRRWGRRGEKGGGC